VAAGEDAEIQLREAVILASLIVTPQVAVEFESQLEGMVCRDPENALLRDTILRGIGREGIMRDLVEDVLGPHGVENLLSARHVSVVPCIRSPGNPEQTRAIVAAELAKLDAHWGLQAELEEAHQDMQDLADEAITWRLGEAAKTRAQAGRGSEEDDAEFAVGKNGAHIDKEEKSAFDSLLSQIGFGKSGN